MVGAQKLHTPAMTLHPNLTGAYYLGFVIMAVSMRFICLNVQMLIPGPRVSKRKPSGQAEQGNFYQCPAGSPKQESEDSRITRDFNTGSTS